MQTEQLIMVETFCSCHNVEVSFVTSLNDYGLVEIVTKENVAYIPESRLREAEQLVRLHNDLQLTADGLEIVTLLLEQLKEKNEQINLLANKLRFYEY
jgi:hypothetical protein